MEYIDVVNEETQLKERLKACEEKYALDVSNIQKRLGELQEHKQDFLNGDKGFAYAREYVTVRGSLDILGNFKKYISILKNTVSKDYKQLLECNLNILAEKVDYDFKTIITLYSKGEIPSGCYFLGGVNFSKDTPSEYFSELFLELEKNVPNELKTYAVSHQRWNYDALYTFNGIEDKILKFDIKTDEYDYTRLFKLLNFPEEIFINNNRGETYGKYKLVGDSYIFFIYYSYDDVWVNQFEEYNKNRG